MDEFGVAVFRDQPFTDEAQIAFFAQLRRAGLATNNLRNEKEQRLGAHIADISTSMPEQRRWRARIRRRPVQLGTRLWHSDSSFKVVPASIARCCRHALIPSKDGNTEFADMRAAYDALDDDTTGGMRGPGLRAQPVVSRAQIGFADFTDEERRLFAPCTQRSDPAASIDRPQVAVHLASHAAHDHRLAHT